MLVGWENNIVQSSSGWVCQGGLFTNNHDLYRPSRVCLIEKTRGVHLDSGASDNWQAKPVDSRKSRSLPRLALSIPELLLEHLMKLHTNDRLFSTLHHTAFVFVDAVGYLRWRYIRVNMK